jgi:protoporphyrinogen oxidase
MNTPRPRYAVIAGAGPAGLTCALELLRKTSYIPIIIEKDSQVGGISKTVIHNKNHLDIGGHRFFSKSDRVLRWWNEVLPFESAAAGTYLTYQGKTHKVSVPRYKNSNPHKRMMLRNRKSRIYYNREFYDYPITLRLDTFTKLGIIKSCKIVAEYMWALIFPIQPEITLEEFYINRFGKELYKTFFKSYTEKIWGKQCSELSAEWGKQRVKGVSLMEVVKHFFFKKLNIRQNRKTVKTSLMDNFLYPVYGPGQLWEEVARMIKDRGGKIILQAEVSGITVSDKKVQTVHYRRDGKEHDIQADYFFSTMPVQQLVMSVRGDLPDVVVSNIAVDLEYRDFITVGLLAEHLKLESKGEIVKDNWIYIHEPHVECARIQFFNNWSEKMVSNPQNHWIGVEYIVSKEGSLWNKSNEEIKEQAIYELEYMGIISRDHIIDHHVERIEKAYPVYAGSYADFSRVKEYVNSIDNLFLIGRNGMHRYNNQDHSMLTAMAAVDMIAEGKIDKKAIWDINTDDEYHEEKR